MTDSFNGLYKVKLDSYFFPSDRVLGRLWREITRGQPTVLSVTRIRSLFHGNRPSNEQRYNMGEAVMTIPDHTQEMIIRSIYEYYVQLRTMVHGYAII